MDLWSGEKGWGKRQGKGKLAELEDLRHGRDGDIVFLAE